MDTPVAPEVLTICRTEVLNKRYGTIKIELWPEGVVLWVGGQIRWTEWEGGRSIAPNE